MSGEQREIAQRFDERIRHDLRRSYRCGCGPERFDRKGGRVTRLPVAADPAERIMSDVERACGTRPSGCPWHALSHPYVRAVLMAHAHWSKGALDVTRIPHALRVGIETFEALLRSIEAADRREDAEEREREKRAEAEKSKRRGRR